MIPFSSALTAFGAYRRARYWTSARPSRDDLDRHQRQSLQKFLCEALPAVEYYRTRTKPVTLNDLPMTDKSTLMAAFDQFNIPRVSREQGFQAFSGPRSIGPYTIGASTGTSGNRGLFVISERERFLWLGTILAKTIPDFWKKRDRVAVVLPLHTPLYDAANETRFLRLKFFDLTDGPERWRRVFEQFSPTVIIAPPRILRWMAETQIEAAPRRVFSAAETLDPNDRTVIESGFSLKLDEIYMATEGLFAVSCRHNMLHLAEDVMHFEFEPVGNGLVSPIITDFTRRTQIMARYRMNDLLRLHSGPCACGSPLQAVAEVVGRADDCFELPTSSSGKVLITPDILRNAIIDADRRIADFRLILTSPTEIELVLPPELPVEAADAAHEALHNLLWWRGAEAAIAISRQHLTCDPTRKLRRVESRVRKEIPCA